MEILLLLSLWFFGIPLTLILLIYLDRHDYEDSERYDSFPEGRTSVGIAGIFWPLTLLLLIIFYGIILLSSIKDTYYFQRGVSK